MFLQSSSLDSVSWVVAEVTARIENFRRHQIATCMSSGHLSESTYWALVNPTQHGIVSCQ